MFSLKQWQDSPHWQNWVGYVTATPEQKLTPESIEALQDIVKNAVKNNKRVRVTGAGHSFSGCAKPEEIAVSLHHLRGIDSVDSINKEVTVFAGTYLYEMGDLLREHGFAMQNMGDIQNQTVAGSISTGTHGTGITLGSVSSQIVAWEWVDGLGNLHQHRRGDDDLSNALHIHMGMLGIFTRLTLKVVDLYGLREESAVFDFDTGLAQFDEAMRANRHMEWFLFPGTNKLQQKILSVIEPKPMSKWQKFKDKVESKVVLNGAFYLASELARKNPKYTKSVSQLSADNIPNTIREGYSYEVFPKPRGVRFNESEYFIKYSDFDACIRHINEALLEDTKSSHFPIEVRSHKAETGFLSPTQGNDSVVLSFHVYKGIDSEPFFNWVKEQMAQWQGRPHWGKVNKLSHQELLDLYPDLPKFLALRQQYDPHNVFINEWLAQKFLNT
ncbi:D-arabinono-1,4-lactone oxidase [Psychrobacter sp. I-STPA6b]|uniref:D-arabinono-1,4-lactone oxidase n=1 Tax=Psychrobacter sp. I-STPA6b TaxID=2585718 RepID=UPI001D0C5AAD|nr:D-arabinono-1,4-lactone oxidase [Psychrobacter sp. I-STPA6b]